MSHTGSSGSASLKLVAVSYKDTQKLDDALVFIKSMSTKKLEKKAASEVLIKLKRLNWTDANEQSPKQIALKPSEMRLLDSLKDTYDIELDYPHIGTSRGHLGPKLELPAKKKKQK
jgi:hypothetical protein